MRLHSREIISNLYRLKQAAKRLEGPGIYTLISIIGPVVAIGTGTLVAKWLTPKELGVIQTASLLSPYLSFLHLGVYNGLNREYPYLIGRGDTQKAIKLVGASWLVTKWITLISGIIGISFAIYLTLSSADPQLVIAVWFTLPVILSYPFNTHFETLFRTGQDFKNLGKIIGIGYLISLVSVIPVKFLKFWGQNIRLLVISIVNSNLRWIYAPIKKNTPGTWVDVLHLVKIGFPFLLASYIYNLLNIADRSVIALKLGAESVGFYSLTIIVVSSTSAISLAMAQVQYPKILTHYGATGEKRLLRNHLFKSIMIQTGVLIPVAIIGFILLPHLVNNFLPAYRPGIRAAQMGLILSVLNLQGPVLIINVLKRNITYIMILSFSTICLYVGSFYALSINSILESVVYVRILITIFITTATLIYSIHLTR